jgi:hypothetical protein
LKGIITFSDASKGDITPYDRQFDPSNVRPEVMGSLLAPRKPPKADGRKS